MTRIYKFINKIKNYTSVPAVLYISYDGMFEPLGQSQVLAYLKKLANDREIYLLSFEKQKDILNKKKLDSLKKELALSKINWIHLRYHRKLTVLATAFDIICGIIISIYLVIKYRIKIVHARSYVPSVIALVIKRLLKVKYIFDMRGFWADEKVDAGSWSAQGILYKITKEFERRFILGCDHLVSLTHAGIHEIKLFKYISNNMPPYSVIPTCADLRLFCPLPKLYSNKKNNIFVLGYIGSVGAYYLFDEVINCFINLLKLRPEARLFIINRDQHDYILNRLNTFGVPNTKVELISAIHSEIPMYVSRMDAGIFFYKPVFSKLATAPTRLAEFLGCGIPCLANTGVGDLSEVLEGEEVGVAIKSFDSDSILKALNRLLELAANPTISVKCVRAAEKYFSLDEGVKRYSKIYNILS